ncbi:MAG: amidohydrolase family protein [Lachnospiraceae bacterium]|nr:amidohydrolase family protein [Lachnospiraceae bacterium]
MKTLVKAQSILIGSELELVKNKCIVINEGKIEVIIDQSEMASYPDASLIDLGSKTLMPGMIECHDHLCIDARIPNHLELLATASAHELTLIAIKGLKDDLMSGVTTARCMGDFDYIDVNLNKKIKDGTIYGPKLLTAGKGMKTAHGAGHIGYPHNGPEEIRKTARENLKKGVDIMKLFATPGVAPVGQDFIPAYLSREEISTVVSEGKRLNVPTAAHCIGGQALTDCVEMGVSVIEHAYAATDADVTLLKEHDTWVDLTSGIFLDEEREAFLSPDSIAKTRYHRENVRKSLAKIVKAGIHFSLGTDANHGLLYKEIGFAIELGADARTALKGVTSNAAIVANRENSIGCITEGFAADLIAVSENPLEHYETLHNVSFVMKDGITYKALDGEAEVVKARL